MQKAAPHCPEFQEGPGGTIQNITMASRKFPASFGIRREKAAALSGAKATLLQAVLWVFAGASLPGASPFLRPAGGLGRPDCFPRSLPASPLHSGRDLCHILLGKPWKLASHAQIPVLRAYYVPERLGQIKHVVDLSAGGRPTQRLDGKAECAVCHSPLCIILALSKCLQKCVCTSRSCYNK